MTAFQGGNDQQTDGNESHTLPYFKNNNKKRIPPKVDIYFDFPCNLVYNNKEFCPAIPLAVQNSLKNAYKRPRKENTSCYPL